MLFRLVLAACCGLRRSECVRITPDAILDEKDEVFVSASRAKTGKQRFVPLPTAAKAWLALAKYEPPPDEIDRLHENRHGRCLKKLAEIAGLVLPHNALRHSFASYAAAKTHDIPPGVHVAGTHELQHDGEALPGRCASSRGRGMVQHFSGRRNEINAM